MYKFINVSNHKSICLSAYAGKTVKGVAKCSPNDTWDESTGNTLARLRCDAKIAKLRQDNAAKKLEEAYVALEKAQAQVNKMRNYVHDAVNDYEDAAKELASFEQGL